MPVTQLPLSDAWRRRLYLPAYTVSDAARFAKTNPQRVAYWYHSTSKVGPTLPGRERRTQLSYMQLVEVAFVATFRNFGVPLAKLRDARAYLAQTFEAEFPFAEYRLKTDGVDVILDLASVEEDSDLNRLIIASASGQIAWQPEVENRFMEFEYEAGLAVVWHVAGRESPVRIDPRVAFGAPTVRGIPTWALRGRANAGESIEELMRDFGLERHEVVEALTFEGIPDAA